MTGSIDDSKTAAITGRCKAGQPGPTFLQETFKQVLRYYCITTWLCTTGDELRPAKRCEVYLLLLCIFHVLGPTDRLPFFHVLPGNKNVVKVPTRLPNHILRKFNDCADHRQHRQAREHLSYLQGLIV